MKKNSGLFLMILMSFLLFFGANAFAHCEIPCGIYDDQMRIKMISEDIDTIEKSMNQIMVIEKEAHHHDRNNNQLIRWVMNKEDHADKLMEIVTQYFMTQRIKADTDNYEKKLVCLHGLLVNSMKCKQTTDLQYVETLRKLLKEFEGLYFTGQ